MAVPVGLEDQEFLDNLLSKRADGGRQAQAAARTPKSKDRLTREEILRMIEERGGPEGLDLSDADLSGIDLSSNIITRYVQERAKHDSKTIPVWAIKVIKTAPRGAAFWGLRHKGSKKTLNNPKEVSKLMRYGINLRGACLNGADLRGANLERADLTGAELVQANFEGANLWGCVLDGANLWSSKLMNAFLPTASLQGTILTKANLTNATLTHAVLQGSNLYGANLYNATLYGADLSDATLGNIDLSRVSLWLTNLQNTRLEPRSFKEGILQENKGAFLKHLEHHLGTDPSKYKKSLERRFGEARDIYLSLKANFSNAGYHQAASWAHVKARQMEKQTYHPRRVLFYHDKNTKVRRSIFSLKSWWFYFKNTIKWLSDWIVELTCGYGERPTRVIILVVFTIVLFAFLYQVSGGISEIGSDEPLEWFDYLQCKGSGGLLAHLRLL